MDLERALLAQVEASVASGVPVAWAIAPRDAALPRVVLWKVAGSFETAVDGVTGMRTATIQVDCWGNSYGQAKSLADSVLAGLSGWTSKSDKVHAVIPVGDQDEQPGRDIAEISFRRSLDFEVTFWV